MIGRSLGAAAGVAVTLAVGRACGRRRLGGDDAGKALRAGRARRARGPDGHVAEHRREEPYGDRGRRYVRLGLHLRPGRASRPRSRRTGRSPHCTIHRSMRGVVRVYSLILTGPPRALPPAWALVAPGCLPDAGSSCRARARGRRCGCANVGCSRRILHVRPASFRARRVPSARGRRAEPRAARFRQAERRRRGVRTGGVSVSTTPARAGSRTLLQVYDRVPLRLGDGGHRRCLNSASRATLRGSRRDRCALVLSSRAATAGPTESVGRSCSADAATPGCWCGLDLRCELRMEEDWRGSLKRRAAAPNSAPSEAPVSPSARTSRTRPPEIVSIATSAARDPPFGGYERSDGGLPRPASTRSVGATFRLVSALVRNRPSRGCQRRR